MAVGAGGVAPLSLSLRNPNPNAPPPLPSYGSEGSFGAAAKQQANDYDTIMQGYRNVAQRPGLIAPQVNYSQSSDTTGALSNLSDLSRTGGYSDANIADLRSRGIAPIRSIYANAESELNRNRALSGGYSPSYNATAARMAREMSDKIGQATQDVNAGIAENQARNRLSASSSYAGAAGAEAGRGLEASDINAQLKSATDRFTRGEAFQALEGQRGLYGTTPALTSTFGNQVATATGLKQNQQQIDNQRMRDIFGAANSVFT